MKRISVIGSTGSIGTQALDVIAKHSDKFRIVALTANENADLLVSQAKTFGAEYAGICKESAYEKVRGELNCKVECGEDCLAHAAALDCDIVLVAVVGCAGLKAVLSAIENGHNVALANKESLVAAGELVTNKAREKGVALIPVDSEHSAVWQCLNCGEKKDLKRLILTASGGPFYNRSKDELCGITPEQAVAHPTWKMGKKISVDSATMMNKGLEIIEARWLFDTLNIDYVIHPQSIIHSMVEYNDGAVIAQLSSPDMKLPIQLAFTYPRRFESSVTPLPLCGNLTFAQPKEDVFPLPSLAKRSLELGGNASCILNAANEAAVELFLNGKISFTAIAETVERVLTSAKIKNCATYDEIIETHNEVYAKLMTDYKTFTE